MKRDAIQLVRSIYRANKAKDKVVYLETFLDDFELLKFIVFNNIQLMKFLENPKKNWFIEKEKS